MRNLDFLSDEGALENFNSVFCYIKNTKYFNFKEEQMLQYFKICAAFYGSTEY